MKKHLCRTLMALGLTLAAVGASLPTAWADEPNPPAGLRRRSADGSRERASPV